MKHIDRVFSDLRKAVEETSDENKISADIQGSYTDHNMSPYMRRDLLDPMYGDELEAFEWGMKKVMDADPSLVRMMDVVRAMESENIVYVDEQGMLRVNPYYPDSNPNEI